MIRKCERISQFVKVYSSDNY